MRLGIVGMSEGNGHPYSWSAIFNGYNPEVMKDCPFPAIPDYLAKQHFPEDGLGTYGQVTHIWTQDRSISDHIARASRIDNVVDDMQDMIGEVDAVLLARDDAESHYEMALPFLEAGIPVFIDKPLALSEKEAQKILGAQRHDDQIFSCSSIRFAKELRLSENEKQQIGEIRHVEASVPKKWDTYAVHVIEPMLVQLPDRGKLKQVIPFNKNNIQMCIVEWEKVSAYIKVTGATPSPIKLEFFGEMGNIEKRFFDSFSCFRESLEKFMLLIEKQVSNIDRSETLEIVKIIEKGRT